MKNILLLLSFSFVVAMASGQTTSVLFIGNSYTYVNNLPQTFHDLALSKGDTVIFDSSAPGGYTFNLHTTNATTISKINQQPWDYVVLQEQSQMPAFPPTQVATDTYPYATQLNNIILANDSCTETVFYMTWGRENGDSSNCAAYPPICTYAGMQQRLRESYLQMATDNHASCSPVGVAWKHVRDNYPSIVLYNADQSHPSVNGTYLAACVFYASLFHKTPIGATYPGGITSGDVLVLQTIGGATVLDSLSLWQGTGDIPNATFAESINGNIVQFNNTSFNATDYSWDFGDASNSSQTNPAHTYSSIGQYVVSLTAGNACKSFVVFDTIQINNITGVSSLDENHSILIYPNPAKDILTVEIKNKIGNKIDIRFYNSFGQLVISKQTLNETEFQLDVSRMNSGLYAIIIYENNKIVVSEKIVIRH